ncbi:MAG: hypothetical protein M3125_09580 [Gemmatimonadota bacterium]|nr:hypothetical protein [Gemmatimonadota bacterium]
MTIPPSSHDTPRVAEQVETLVTRLSQSPDPAVRHDAQELVRLLMTLYGSGLARILEILERDERDGRRLVNALGTDDLIASLLVLHDLHPDDSATRISRGLEKLQSVAGVPVVLLDVVAGTVRVRVDAGHEPPTPALRDLPQLISEMVSAVAPDVTEVHVEGLPPKAPAGLVQLTRHSALSASGEVRIQ